MDKKSFQTDQAPKAVGPYSQAIESHGLFFISGQIPIDPKTNQPIASRHISDQAVCVLQNIENILKARGLTTDHVIKTTIFLKNISDFTTVNDIYQRFFKKEPPARSTVEVSNLPKDVLIEIETIATLN